MVLIERYHAGSQGRTARWELKDGEWHCNGSYYDQGTHFHVFCAAYDENADREDWQYQSGLQGEAYLVAYDVWSAAYDKEHAGEDDDWAKESAEESFREEWDREYEAEHSRETTNPGHEWKAWGRDLPEVLQQVVYPGSFSEVKHEDAEVEERPRRRRNYNRAKSVTKQMLTEIVNTAIEAVQQGRVPDGVRELKDGRLVFSARKLLGEHGDGPKQTIEGRANRLKAILNEKLDRAGFVRDARMGYRRP